MPSAPSLAQTQALLWKLITAPEGAAAGLARLTPVERGVSACVRGDHRLSALERLDIYADMYFYRLRDCLKDDFAVVSTVVGEGHFHNLITDYLLAHPPAHSSLRYAGQHLPGFLAGHPLSTRWPYLADLAALEWAILDAFDAPDAPPLKAETLALVAPEEWPGLRFDATPSLRLLGLSWPVHEIWRTVQDGAAPLERETEIPPHRTSVRVWRQDLLVFHRAIDPAETAALRAIASKLPFAAVCERIVESAGELAGTERALTLIREWLADGLLTGVHSEGPSICSGSGA